VRLEFEDGLAATIDLAPLLARGGVFTSLRDPVVFSALEIGERGHTLVWHDHEGDPIDLCADALWLMAHSGATTAQRTVTV
jgi:hypothetical protein